VRGRTPEPVKRAENMTAECPVSREPRFLLSAAGPYLGLASALLLAACEAAPPPGPSVTTRDSSGVTIAENVGNLSEGDDVWLIAPEPSLQIGEMEGDDAYMFQRIWGARRLSDGRIAVVDTRAGDLRIFDPSGRHLHTFGRKGEGPGEFDMPVLMGTLPGDTLLVVDRLLRRVNLFHPDQGFVQEATADPEIQGYLLTVGMFDSGSVLIWGSEWTQDMPNGLFRFPIQYLSVGRDGALEVDFGKFLGNETVYATQQVGEGTTVLSTTLPFGKGPSAAVAGDRFFYSSQDRYEIEVRDESGNLLSIIRRDLEPRPVTDAHVADLMEDLVDDEDDENEQRRQFRRMMRESPLPDFFPALGDIHADALGHLWVEETRVPGEEVRNTTVFDPDGRMVGRVVLPSRFRVEEIGRDYVLGVWVDDLGVNYLRVYDLERPVG